MPDKPRVLHSIRTFLLTTENWVYPQITAVPGIDSAVFCQNAVNLSEFPLHGQPLFASQSPLWRSVSKLSIPKKAIRQLANKADYHTARFRARHWHPSIMHAHFGTQGWESLRFAKSLGAALITSFYGFDAWGLPVAEPEWRGRFKELFVQGNLFLVEGSAFCQRLIDLGCPPGKIRIQRLGVDVSRFAYRQRDFTGTLNIVMVGRFVEKKGLPDGLRACAHARSRGANIRVTIVGDATTGDIAGEDIKRQLIELASSPALSGFVNFAGFVAVPMLRDILSSHHIVLCPSKHAKTGDAEGGYPVIIPESMGAGLLCIGSRHCDIPEVVIDGKTGHLFGEGNVTELAELLYDIASEPSRAIPLVQEARQHVEKNFLLSSQLEKLSEIYVALMSCPAHQRDFGAKDISFHTFDGGKTKANACQLLK
jgi:colanic acid/amylovoran biosynthesis glycosyltransferase